jgi:anti-anti-sigma factor
MRIDLRARGAVDVLDVSGETVDPRVSETLRERVAKLLDQGECLLIVNLTEAPELDSTALGALVTVREQVRRSGGLIKLVLTLQQQDLFLASDLDCLFETYPDEDSALDSFDAETETAGIP